MILTLAQFSAPPGELQKSSSGRKVSSSTSSSKRSSGSGVSTGIMQRRGAIKQFKVAEEIKGHKFVAKFFRHPSFCSICQGFLWLVSYKRERFRCASKTLLSLFPGGLENRVTAAPSVPWQSTSAAATRSWASVRVTPRAVRARSWVMISPKLVS